MTTRKAALAALFGALIATSAGSQEETPEAELAEAVKKTGAEGFTFVIRPALTGADGSVLERQALAGVPISGEQADGLIHARDGSFEIYRSAGVAAARTARGWLALDAFASPYKEQASRAFGAEGREWTRGNVTEGRKALAQLARLSQLNHRAGLARLAGLPPGLVEVRKTEKAGTDGKGAAVYDARLSEAASFEILQGPFGFLVERGHLAFRDLLGVARVTVVDRRVRRIVVRVAGTYAFHGDTEDLRGRGPCVLELSVELSRHGETLVKIPKEAARLLEVAAK